MPPTPAKRQPGTVCVCEAEPQAEVHVLLQGRPLQLRQLHPHHLPAHAPPHVLPHDCALVCSAKLNIFVPAVTLSLKLGFGGRKTVYKN